MAYAAVASISHTIDLILNYHQHSISPRYKHQIISIQKHTNFLQSFFEDAPDRANHWEEEIREVTDKAEDIIELLVSDLLLESIDGSSRSKLEKGKYQVHYGFHELELVKEEIESIANRVKAGGQTKAGGGSDDELTEIISRLRKGSYDREIIPIFGMGGIGKTTLARKAYNNPFIVDHFDIRAWSTISQDYRWQQVSSDLLRSANKLNSGSVDMAFYGKRYLVVLDDVWSSETCNDVKRMLPNEGNGSRIILTTRSSYVAESAGHVHHMRFFDEDTTWNLLRENVFKGDLCPSQLEYVGKMIARRCIGHPLTIEVLSGLLAADQTEAAWEDIAQNIKSAGNVVDLYEILSLSYTYLPHHLRPCFLYLASFPEYHEIHVPKLIKLWVAEGFLNESECKSFEETGEEHVEDLVRRNIVSVSERKSNGRTKSIRVHDVMRDVCLIQARKESFTHHVTRFYSFDQEALTMNPQSCRRVSAFTYGDNFLKGVYGSTIRTIMLYLEEGRRHIIRCSIGNVRLLRILDLSNAYHYDLPEEVYELFHLRYLTFYCGLSISEAISNLENLQTLIICPRENDSIFANFPEGIWRMPQLRHLLMFSFKLPTHNEVTSALLNLQTLSRVVNFICSRENLKITPNLKKLALFYTSRDMVEDYELHNLIHLQKLEILKIEMDWSFWEQQKIISCAFPPTLKKLSLDYLRLAWEDMKNVGLLPNLQVLKLRKHACTGKTWETSEGGFSQLTYLLIDESNLENWITESTHFPKLKSVVFRCCLHLLEVPNNIVGIPTLELIELDKKNKSLLRSAKRIQEDRQGLGDDDHLRICVV